MVFTKRIINSLDAIKKKKLMNNDEQQLYYSMDSYD